MDRDDLDMSPGSEMFPESTENFNEGQSVGDPLDTGVSQSEAAAHKPESDKEMNFRAIRDELSKLKEEREYWKGQADAFARAPVRNEPSAREPYNPFKDVNDEDWVKGSNVKEAYQSLRNEFYDRMAAIEAKSQHNDWNTMVTQHVPQLTSKNPMFAEMIQRASNPYEAAYLLAELNARTSQAVAHEPPLRENENAQRAIANAQKPVSVASIGGKGALSMAEKYANMSDKDFMEFAAKNLANI